MDKVNMRYIVSDVDAVIRFYTEMFGFKNEMHPAPGGWNCFQIEIGDLASTADKLKSAGYRFRNEMVVGNGGKQILAEDPSGNCVELFKPFRADAARGGQPQAARGPDR